MDKYPPTELPCIASHPLVESQVVEAGELLEEAGEQLEAPAGKQVGEEEVSPEAGVL